MYGVAIEDSEGNQPLSMRVRTAFNCERMTPFSSSGAWNFFLSSRADDRALAVHRQQCSQTIVTKQGVGRVRHLSGKLLWIKEVSMGHVSTLWNYSYVGTKALKKSREIANMVAFNAMGSQNHLGMVRQRYRQLGATDNTDQAAFPEGPEEEESLDEDTLLEEGENPLTELLDMLRVEGDQETMQKQRHFQDVGRAYPSAPLYRTVSEAFESN